MLDGGARTYHVDANAGRDVESGGAEQSPWRTIQYAVNRALPGDRIVLAPGVYHESVWVSAGGARGAPVVIESATPLGAAIDGRRRFGRLLQIVGVNEAVNGFAASPQGYFHLVTEERNVSLQ